LNRVDFPEETGGSADQNLAVPFLAGMDDIEVLSARITLGAVSRDLEIENYTVTANGDAGAFLSLPLPARLKKIEIAYTLPQGTDAANVRVVLRGATPAGNGFSPGVPLFAIPDFGKSGPMYDRVLGGMSVTALGGDRQLIGLPGVLGAAWLIQLAFGDDPTELAPLNVVPAVRRVTLDAAPRNLSVALTSGGDEILLWNNPETLFPDAGIQEVSFTPLAQRHLTSALESAAVGDVTLPVPLRFTCDTGGAIQVVETDLKARYLVRPLGTEPVTLRLGGDTTPLTLAAPAGRIPESSRLRMRAKLLGRELNGASPEPSGIPPSTGLRVRTDRFVAAAAAVAPLAGSAPGSVLDLAAVRLYLAAPSDADAVLEIRSDVAANPGPIAAPPVVRQVKAGFCGWLEFAPAKPLTVAAGLAPLWLALRSNRGDILWFAGADAGGAGRISVDKGETWGQAEPLLTPAGGLLAQLFHVVPPPLPAPVIRLRKGAVTLKENLLAASVKTAENEYVLEASSLPPGVHNLLAAGTGTERVDTELHLFSRSVLDLTLENLVIRYDPFQTPVSGG
ncbi:MAG TPA: hypothetical protein VLT88_04585, partial [Desulfosarcina sp.]|nr:hypothetical protein [Desulfosarcina sp.]